MALWMAQVRNAAGQTPLWLAAQAGQTGACEALLDAGAPMESASASEDETPLMVAAWEGHAAVLQLLLQVSASHPGCCNLFTLGLQWQCKGHPGVTKQRRWGSAVAGGED